MSLSDQLKNLENLVSNAMGTALEDAERTLSQQIRKLSGAVQQRAEEQALDRLHDSIARIDRASDQATALSALLEEVGHYASRSVLFLTFTDGIRGWASYGFTDEIEALDSLEVSGSEAPFRKFSANPRSTPLDGDDCDPICKALGGEAADEGILVPMVLRNRVAAALYADRVDARDIFVPSAIAVLVHVTAQQIESQGRRRGGATATLDASGAAAGLGFWDPADAATRTEVADAPTALEAPVESDEGLGLAAFEPSETPDEEFTADEPDQVAHEEEADDLIEEASAPEEVDEEVKDSSSATDELDSEDTEASPATSDDSPMAAMGTIETDVQSLAAGDEEPSTEATVRISREVMEAYIQKPRVDDLEGAADTDSDADTGHEHTEAQGEAAEPEEIAIEDLEVEDLEVEGLEVEGLDIGSDVEPEVEEAEDLEIADLPPIEEPVAETPAWAAPETSEVDGLDLETVAEPEMPSVVEFESPDVEVAPIEDATEEVEEDDSENQTVLLDRETLTTPVVALDAEEEAPAPIAAPTPIEPPPPAELPATPEPTARPSVLAGGSTQVQPPADLEGPGWAFRTEDQAPPESSDGDPEAAALHEEARRLARLLVSEIKLYNEEQVEDGRRSGDIYARLQDDIERSHQMYRDRVDSRVGDDVDYFQQELVNILAGGDANALGK